MNADIIFLLKKILSVVTENKNNEEYQKTLLRCRDKGVLDTADLIALFKNSERTIERWRNTGYLKYKKIDGRCYYKWADIMPMLD